MENIILDRATSIIDRKKILGNSTDHTSNLVENWIRRSSLSEEQFIEKINYYYRMSLSEFNEVLNFPFSNLSCVYKIWIKTFNEIIEYYDSEIMSDMNAIDVFINPFLIYFKLNIEDFEDFHKIMDMQLITQSLVNSLRTKLFHLTSKTIINDYYNNKNSDITTFEMYGKIKMNPTYIKFLFNKYPVMAKLMTNITIQMIEYSKQILKDYIKDYNEIQKFFKSNETLFLNNVSLDLGDTHNNGKTVAIFEFESMKLLYKPRNLKIDVAFENTINWFNDNGLNSKIKTPKTLVRKGYGWQEFISYKSPATEEEINIYFEKMGSLIAILYILNSTDMHYENLICCGSDPVIIDLESIISNNSFITSDKKFPLNKLVDTIMGSGILPTGNIFNSSIDTDISVLGGIPGQKSNKNKEYILKEAYGNNPYFEEVHFKTSKQQHIVEYNGEIIDSSLYIKDIRNGLVSTLNIVLNNKEFKNKILGFFQDTEYRVIPRATNTYFKFLTAGQHPKYLEDSTEQEFLFELLWNIVETEPQMKLLVFDEIRDLMNNDIPYFYGVFNEKGIYNSSSQLITDSFEYTMSDILSKKIDSINTEDIKKQVEILNLCMENHKLRDCTIQQVEMKSYKGDINLPTDKKKLAVYIGDTILDRVINNEKRDKNIWIGLYSDSEKDKYSLNIPDHSLYNGVSGTIIFLLSLYKVTEEKKYLECALKSARLQIKYYKENYKFLTFSALNGIGALIYISLNCYLVTKDEKFYKDADFFIKKIHNYKLENVRIPDFMSGHAGMISLLSSVYTNFGHEDCVSLIKKISKDLEKRITKDSQSFEESIISNGIAHGIPGYICAIEQLNRVTNDEFTSLSNKLLSSFEDELNESVKSPGFWCTGVAGNLLINFYFDNLSEKKKEENINLLERNLYEMDRICLCHGVFGNLNIINSLNKKIRDDKRRKKIIDTTQDLINLETIRGKIQYMIYTNQSSLYLGYSGVGYSLLRILDLNLPDIFTFEFFDGEE